MWRDYLLATKDNRPSELLKEALAYVECRENALDLGAGALNETYFLARAGFNVVAVDASPEVLEYVRADTKKVSIEVTSFDSYKFPISFFDLINARYSLPFNPPKTFAHVFTAITASLKPGGVLVGQLFGMEDGWSGNARMTFLPRQEVENLLTAYTVHTFREKHGVRPTATGSEKFWHVFDIIAQKK